MDGDPEANFEVGDFRIVRRIASGGMGVVYQAQQISLGRTVALKVLGSALTHAGDITRFRREAQAVARLNHPGIAAIYYAGQNEQVCYMAMEYVDGVTLRSVILRLAATSQKQLAIETLLQEDTQFASRPPLIRFDDSTDKDTVSSLVRDDNPPSGSDQELTPEAECLIATTPYVRWVCQVVRAAAEALDHAHSHRVVHRDIKPQNIMLDRAGGVHLIDFGIARFFEDLSVTETGQLIGTPMYMSPEQVAGQLNVDHRTDIYSLGLVMYELLTLRRPLAAPTRDAMLRGVISKAMIPASWKNKGVPRSVESVVHKAIAKDPEERYQSAAEFAEDLQRCIEVKPVSAAPYFYKFDEREIAADRPWSIIVSATLLFIVAGYFLLSDAVHEAVSVRDLLRRNLNRPDLMQKRLVALCIHTVVGLGSIVAGYALLRARYWARWSAILLGTMTAGLEFNRLFLIGWRATRRAPNASLGEQVLLFMGDPDYTVFRLFLAAGGLFIVLVLLFQPQPKVWFRRSQQIRSEHDQLLTSLRTVTALPRSSGRLLSQS